MKSLFLPGVVVALGLLSVHASPYARDTFVRCESQGYRQAVCRLPTHGYVRLERQFSDTRCVKGRNWDYNAREIWVDDGCAAEFRVELREHDRKDNDAVKAAAAVAALAILGAVIVNAADDKDHHADDDYGHGGHASYVPKWMVGDFRAWNDRVGAEVLMTVESDGRLRAKSGTTRVTGYVNDRRMYVGDAVFEVERTDVGFNTVQVGDWRNRVAYRRH